MSMVGKEGKWWRGVWTADNIRTVVGPKPSDKLLETFAVNLADAFVKGELHVGNWSTTAGAKIDLTIGPTSKKPLSIPLAELSAVEAAAYASSVFLEIALQAQSRQCRLQPAAVSSVLSPIDYMALLGNTRNVPEQAMSMAMATKMEADARPMVSETKTQGDIEAFEPPTSTNDKDRKEKLRALKAQIDQRRQVGKKKPSAATSTLEPRAQPRPLKGASLANPNKKARKYQALEFESDEE